MSETLKIVLGIIHLIICIGVIVIVLMQSGKAGGLSGSIAGGAETFFGKGKGKAMDKMLSKYTVYIAAFFAVTSIFLYLVLK
ncbi:MAG TPA: preprotein translocase subunit SecG [Clostridia bacterium]|jgi:preprotein translocase subunit SecG|nr:preprotein translocase subunit SecG [Clostridia bacterium]MDD3972255.1 preprotein translocase subunit SecG [Clostridia bacterium]NLF36320.1 preprotein translocase subunit SecG [Clostridiaceae bacterium]HPJ75370.1 preprotein translocase subunit SecG [Clostridia bacterium]HXK71977.1 preprotein translocase subunit SecG [Clostridia bacterium]